MMFYIDDTTRSPLENMAINAKMLDQHTDGVTGRFYTHDNGVILGKSQSIKDVNREEARRQNYQVVRRNTGGAAIIAQPNRHLCYSLFIDKNRFDSNLNITDYYNELTKPIAQELGDDFHLRGTYYIHAEKDEEDFPVIGHALRVTSNTIQLDGLIHMQALTTESLDLLHLRTLQTSNDEKYIRMNSEMYNLKGEVANLTAKEEEELRPERDEREELQKLQGMRDIGYSEDDLVESIIQATQTYSNTTKTKKTSLNIDADTLRERKKRIANTLNKDGKRGIGHCFIYLEEENREYFI